MSQGQVAEIETEGRESAADNYESWLRGGEGDGTPVERSGSLTFQDLKSKAVSAGAALKEDPFSTPDATKASFFAAFYRDSVYAHASRGRLLALGAHNALREYHEGVRISKDSGIE